MYRVSCGLSNPSGAAASASTSSSKARAVGASLLGGLKSTLPRRLMFAPGEVLDVDSCFARGAMTLSIWTRRAILLLDGFGAVVTAVTVGLILPLLQPWIGLPTLILRLLGGFAMILAVYSLSRHLTGRTTPTALRRVASANLAYCALTAALVAWHARDVTVWGFAYFGVEIMIIIALSWRELSLARSDEP
jgi:hypothetical protein